LESTKDKLRKRLFIAIDIPEVVKENIYNFSRSLLGEDRGIKIVPASNIHITLKFLGDIDISKINKIEEAIKKTANLFKKFKYEISGKINAFPNTDNARVIFLEVGMGGDQIYRIYNELENNLGRIKIKREKRKFSSHITIARLRNRKNIKQLIEKCKLDVDIILDCSEIVLFESNLKPDGAEYIILNNFSLK